MGSGNLSVDDLESISLASHSSEDGRAVEPEVKSFGEFAGGISDETNLCYQRISVSRQQ